MAQTVIEVSMPANYVPRSYQEPLWKYFESGGKRAVCVWHRRAGKDLSAINILGTAALQRVGLYWHVFPTYEQGRRVAWDGKTKDGDSFMDSFPKELVNKLDQTRMACHIKNGSIYQIVGAEDPSRLVGANPIGVIFSEWSIMNPSIWEFIRPILAENEGWAIFVYTPRGRNHGYDLYQMAKNDPNWYCELLSCNDTHAIPLSAIDDERKAGMPDELIQQEFYCSFDASLVGSYFGKEMTRAREEGRVLETMPIDPFLPVDTAWDLGMNDDTTIWFFQQGRGEVRLIDYYSNNGFGLKHYINILHEKNYLYGKHYAPHDIQVRSLSTGKTRLETARALGLRFQIIPKLDIEDGIEAVRNLLPICWFNESKCKEGVRALQEYKKEWDDKRKCFKPNPLHDWTSHGADAMRGLAVAIKSTRLSKSAQKRSQHALIDYEMFKY